MPRRSSLRARAAVDSGSHRAASSIVARPIGTLIQNTGRQEEPSTSTPISSPPTSCPAMVAIPIAMSSTA